jgi:hypothetical protein
MASVGGRPFARQVKIIEWLKAELAASVGAVLRALVAGTEDAIVAALASLVLTAYVLGRRVGVSFVRLDMRVARAAEELIASGHEIERSYGDLSELVAHLGGRTSDGA